jgi:hypothetical protein
VLVRYRGRPDDLKFSVMLQAPTADGWQMVCLIDNAEGKGTHMHHYRGTRKLPGRTFHQGSAREGVPAASVSVAATSALYEPPVAAYRSSAPAPGRGSSLTAGIE